MKKFFAFFAVVALMFSYSCAHVIYFDKTPVEDTEDTADNEVIAIPKNEIWHTSTDEKIVVPNQPSAFNTKTASITYADGKGIIKFEGGNQDRK